MRYLFLLRYSLRVSGRLPARIRTVGTVNARSPAFYRHFGSLVLTARLAVYLKLPYAVRRFFFHVRAVCFVFPVLSNKSCTSKMPHLAKLAVKATVTRQCSRMETMLWKLRNQGRHREWFRTALGWVVLLDPVSIVV